ncbi:uncharacterized protein Tco025E_04672 [Trypanosoma conorhini]|uniref:Uncharacterized protein n=1 Tax=Trypanosoma conorhini TaxID=83891 RepID=A0A422PJX9_9TRYP|nr:uncharacterized protein Tco025E_04672 [Trypanosoma conorhini]RNF18013.1 hypothetical protein Tco025E_04672 [Trypanosoma conorhini]
MRKGGVGMLRAPPPRLLALERRIHAGNIGAMRASSCVGVQLRSCMRNSGQLPRMTAHACLLTPRRGVAYKTDAASFESEVIQSQQAICLVYHRPDSSSCNAYLAHAERLVNRLNKEVSGTGNETGGDGDTQASAPTQKAWLKLCTINADENRNLASAFSVERAKLPVTYFIMQGTIIDKVTGHVVESRLEGILRKFLDHYQQQLNVDLMRGGAPERQNPLPAAATADLLHGASTQYLQNRIMDALVGPEHIRLPEESEQIDGLRKTIQQAKKKAFDELQELRKELGMDVRRLSETELHTRYHRSSQYMAFAVLSALEALFLARVHASIGNIAAENIVFALNAMQRDLSPALADPTVRRLISLCEVLLVRGEVVLQQRRHQQQREEEQGQEAAGADAAASAYAARMLHWIDDVVDTRVVAEQFPSDEVEAMFALLKSNLLQSRRQASPAEEGEVKAKAKEETESARRVRQLKTCLLGVLQLYHADRKSQDARSRLSSLLY